VKQKKGRNSMSGTRTVLQLYPPPQREVDLAGLYLQTPVSGTRDDRRVCVYTNFIASLDGRIAIEDAVTGKRGVPKLIANPRDWRLFQELAACADVLLVSANLIRELVQGKSRDNLPVSADPAFADLREWRVQQGLPRQPAVVILSIELNLPFEELGSALDRPVYVATGKQTDAEAVRKLERNGVRLIYAGEGNTVDGKHLIEQLAEQGFRNIYSIAGPTVLETLLRARVLDRIYLTQVHRVLGGDSYDTLFEGPLLQPPADFELRALYHDSFDGTECGQLFGIYEAKEQKSTGRNSATGDIGRDSG
jgi:riboflavin biosynthesis pyrimidine reductase